MIVNLSEQHSLVSNWVSELRDVQVQTDRMRFRRNLERIGEVAAYELSKLLSYNTEIITTPLGTHNSKKIAKQPVLATILRAGLPLHNGMLNYFDKADNAFISAYRKHNVDGSFEIALDYISCADLNDRVVIISDPMLATGASIVKTIEVLKAQSTPAAIFVVCAIASKQGIESILKTCGADITIFCGDIDEELSQKGYILPGLGDAGDLAFGQKIQQ